MQHHLLILVVALTVLLDCSLYYPLLDLRGGGFVGVVPLLSRSGIEFPRANYVYCLRILLV